MIIVFADSNAPTYLYDGALAMGNLMNATNAFRRRFMLDPSS